MPVNSHQPQSWIGVFASKLMFKDSTQSSHDRIRGHLEVDNPWLKVSDSWLIHAYPTYTNGLQHITYYNYEKLSSSDLFSWMILQGFQTCEGFPEAPQLFWFDVPGVFRLRNAWWTWPSVEMCLGEEPFLVHGWWSNANSLKIIRISVGYDG